MLRHLQYVRRKIFQICISELGYRLYSHVLVHFLINILNCQHSDLRSLSLTYRFTLINEVIIIHSTYEPADSGIKSDHSIKNKNIQKSPNPEPTVEILTWISKLKVFEVVEIKSSVALKNEVAWKSNARWRLRLRCTLRINSDSIHI